MKLYQDGKLVGQIEYLTRSLLYESESIKKAYKNGTGAYLKPQNTEDFNMKWNSLLNANNYPTIKHIQDDDKDIILTYKKPK